ncbi:rubredoxin [Thermodesulfobium narugense DSM 14796]|uniref:ferredoxin:thioredoxin reductase n=1 Tax=Thermodesulfobium narugense DSM 14796 TaxID=747365 RepID=M1E8L2_9BACT|nr:ferredoxin-thioredoxin reductase catalytic domain-containing protein [Thermodesulfobium narugense]AEE15228.1 rubredoxin [Thermodesulfobium narugense DSM 14796]
MAPVTPEKLFEILTKYAHSKGQELNNNLEHTMSIIRGILENERRNGYRGCPCRLNSGDREKDKDIICPCAYKDKDVEEYGSCYCGLYVSHEWNQNPDKRVTVPERRPFDKLFG